MISTTIGICAYNEEWNIGNLLSNLLTMQNLEPNSEIIVVCSGCTDRTPNVVRSFSRQDRRVRVIKEARRDGKAAAVNRILSEAKGKSIVLLPADVTPIPGCIQLLLEAALEDGVGMACGRPTPIRRGRTLVREMVQTLWGFHNWQAERLNHEGLLMHASEIFCIRNGVADKVPRDIVNEDAYLAVAVKNAGYKIRYVRASQVLVSGPQTISDYIKQRRRIIAGHYQVRKVTGKFSQYLFYSMLARPKITIRLLSSYFASTHRIMSGVAVCLVEVVSNLLAFMDIVRGRSHAVWDISTTTKTQTAL